MKGIQEIKDVLAFGLSLQKAYSLAQADGKIGTADLGLLVDPMMKLMPAIENIKDVPAELKDLSDQERGELSSWVKASYDIADDELEKKIEGGIDLMLHLAAFLGVLGVYGKSSSPDPAA